MTRNSSTDPVRDACWRAITDTGATGLIAAHCRKAFGWSMSQRAAEAKISQWLNPRDPHQLPAEELPIVVGCVGDSLKHELIGLLLAVEPLSELEPVVPIRRVRKKAKHTERDRRRGAA